MRAFRVGKKSVNSRPTMCCTIFGISSLAMCSRVHEGTVAQNADFVGQIDDLLEPVGDVDEGRPSWRSRRTTSKSLLASGSERRGRLVHDEDRGVVPQGLENLDDLAVAGGEVLDRGRRIDVEAERCASSAAWAIICLWLIVKGSGPRGSAPRKMFSATVRCSARSNS